MTVYQKDPFLPHSSNVECLRDKFASYNHFAVFFAASPLQHFFTLFSRIYEMHFSVNFFILSPLLRTSIIVGAIK